MIPKELIDLLMPVPGTFLVKRLEMPMRRGRIFLPFATRETNRCSEAEVVISNSEEYCEGDKVLLHQTVQKSMVFGRDEETLWIVRPYQVMARLSRFEDKIELESKHPLSAWTGEDTDDLADDGKVPEGDSGGLL